LRVISFTEVRPVIDGVETRDDRGPSQNQQPGEEAQAKSEGSFHDSNPTLNWVVFNHKAKVSFEKVFHEVFLRDAALFLPSPPFLALPYPCKSLVANH
jgi:hypothetical protein